MSETGSEAGMTLLELLVVMGLLALIATIAVPQIERELGLMQLRETAGALKANLRVIRSDALRSDQAVAFTLSSDGSGYAWSEGETRSVPGQIALRMSKGQKILFYGDGTTSGGAVVATSGGRSISIYVDDATGAVATGR
ncbi:MAG TPA: prepilin-type N-terminal cleavage/methylation domain-containing protein [Rhizomicrobium sp.]